ncbi:MAG TPA: hypothetical protein PKC18_03425 [Lacipirellulaceae bacterium]|nr:hypothetical protein [Lacipirellulaceae bacterium]
MAALHVALQTLEATEQNLSIDRDRADAEAERLQELIRDAEAQLDEMRRGEGRRKSYAIVPYKGQNGTFRRPVFVECTAEAVIIQPEGIRFTAADFDGPLRSGNPLAAAIRAAHEELNGRAAAAGNADMPDPYPLLIVRPDGIDAYGAALDAIRSWDADYGYEFVEGDWTLKYPEPDPRLARVMAHAVDQARQRQALLAKAAPRSYGPRLAGGGGGGGGGSLGAVGGMGSGRGGGIGDLAGGGPDRMGAHASEGALAGGAGGSGAGGGGTGDGNFSDEFAAAPAAASQLLAGSGGGAGGYGGAGDPTAAAGPGQWVPPGESGHGQSTAQNGSSGGAGGAAGSAEGAGNASGAAGGDASGAGGAASAGGAGAEGAPGGTAAAGASLAGAAGGGAPGAAGSAGPAGGATTNANVPLGAAAPTASATVDRRRSAAESRGANWANTEASRRASPIERPIKVDVDADQLLVLDPDGQRSAGATAVSFHQPIDQVLDQFAAAIKARIADWGLAGAGMYWRPMLVLNVAPGADRQAARLAELLEDSGVDVRLPHLASRTAGEGADGRR